MVIKIHNIQKEEIRFLIINGIFKSRRYINRLIIKRYENECSLRINVKYNHILDVYFSNKMYNNQNSIKLVFDN